MLFKIRADLREVTSSYKFRDVDKEGRKGRRERDRRRERERWSETRGAGRSRNRKSHAVETSLVQLLRGWLSSDQERTTNHALANASPRETGFRIGSARTPAIYNAPAAHKDRLLTFFNYTLFTRPRDSLGLQRVLASIVRLSPTITFARYEHVLLRYRRPKTR